MSNYKLIRIHVEDSEHFSRYGDMVVVQESNDTNICYNLTTGKTYTSWNEEGREISPEFLNKSEKRNAEKFKLYQYAIF